MRAKIVATAIELFSRHGLDQVTVEHIADVADIGKGTIYNYFATKEDVVVAFMADLESKIQARVQESLTHRGGNLAQILSDFVLFQFQLKRKHLAFARVFLGQMFIRTAQFLPYMVEMQKVIDPPLEKLFGDLQERGMLRRDVQAPELILTFKAIHLGLTALWAVEGPPFQASEAAVKHAMKLFCEGIKGEKS